MISDTGTEHVNAYDSVISNCRLYSAEDSNERSDIFVKEGRIARIAPAGQTGGAVLRLDAAGRIAAPGFIDVHIQGAGGADVLDASAASLETMSKTLARYGTTGYLATTVYHVDSSNAHLEIASALKGRDTGGSRILGIHLEGPFINPVKKGGLSPDAIHDPSMAMLEDILAMTGGALSMMTIAPELDGSDALIEHLVKHDVVASFGHSNAEYASTLRGIDAGISHVTHMFNVMPGFHHRTPVPLHAIVENDDVSVQIIADGVHLHPATVKMLYRMLGVDRCACITDGIQAVGLPEGHYVYDGSEYESKAGVARYLDGTLIGTAIPLSEIGRRFMTYTGCSLVDAVRSISSVPATVLGLHHRKGDIAEGMDADLVLMDKSFNVYATMVEGQVVFQDGIAGQGNPGFA